MRNRPTSCLNRRDATILLHVETHGRPHVIRHDGACNRARAEGRVR
jgi:hypothetical protein